MRKHLWVILAGLVILLIILNAFLVYIPAYEISKDTEESLQKLDASLQSLNPAAARNTAHCRRSLP